ncbi:hypothetical protein ACVILI_000429 [Mesorhizobium sp. USDA 4775]
MTSAAEMPSRRGASPLRFRQLVGQDRDEDQIVDAEHNLEHHQRQQGDPCGWIGNELKMRRKKFDKLHGGRCPLF